MEKTVLMYVLRLWMIAVSVQGLELKLSGVTVSLTRDHSCCRYPDHEEEDVQYCSCDPFCPVYGDCCLDYWLFHQDAHLNSTVSEAMHDCSERWGASSTVVNGSLPREGGMIENLCDIWEVESNGRGLIHPAVEEYRCSLRALWEPVILRRSSNRRFVSSLGQDNRLRLLQDCSSKASDEEREDCDMERSLASVGSLDDVISLLPVTAQDGLHYKNVECARCHGFDAKDVVFWSLRFYCHPRNLNITAVFTSNISIASTKCSVQEVSMPSTGIPWKAAEIRLVSKAIFDCQTAGDLRACHAYSAPFHHFPNPHCALCTSTIPNSNATGPPSNPDVVIQPRPLSVLFDFSPSLEVAHLSTRGQRSSVIHVCKHGSVFDSSTGRCRAFYCPDGHVVAQDDMTCLPTGNRTNLKQCTNRSEITGDSGSFSCELLLKSEILRRDPRWNVVKYYLEKVMGVQIKTFDLKEDFESRNISSKDFCFIRPTHSYRLVFTFLKRNATIESLTQSTIVVISNRCWNLADTKLTLSISEIRLRNFDTGLVQDECAMEGRELVEHNVVNSFEISIDGVPYTQFKIDNKTFTCPSLEMLQEWTFLPGTHPSPLRSIFMCNVKLKCPIIVLNSTEFTRISQNETELVQRRVNGQIFSISDFIKMANGNIVVCWSTLSTVDVVERSSEDATNVIVSTVGISISQVFLLLSLLNYIMFPEIRRIPGKNMISFILALLVLHFAFLLGPGTNLSRYTLKTKASCLAFAMAIHYLMLAVFFWSNVISFHFVRTFGVGLRMMKSATLHTRQRTFLFYSLYAWGAPAIMVAASSTVHFLLEFNGRPENVYGDGCVIEAGIMFFFGIPALVLMCLNALFMICTLVGIRKTRSDNSFAQTESRRRETIRMEFWLCMKISVATGMLWFILIILAFFRIQGISILVSINFTLQGPLVFFAFAFTARVRGLWKKKLSGATKSSERVRCGRASGCTDNRSAGGFPVVSKSSPASSFTKTTDVYGIDETFTNPTYDIARVETDDTALASMGKL